MRVVLVLMHSLTLMPLMIVEVRPGVALQSVPSSTFLQIYTWQLIPAYSRLRPVQILVLLSCDIVVRTSIHVWCVVHQVLCLCDVVLQVLGDFISSLSQVDWCLNTSSALTLELDRSDSIIVPVVDIANYNISTSTSSVLSEVKDVPQTTHRYAQS